MAGLRGLRALLVAAGLALAAPLQAQTLTIGVRAGPESMDPHVSALGVHVEALTHVYDTLVRSDETLQLRPSRAESWRPVDPTTWEFRLRRGVTFHDGSDLTAEDVKFSIERIPGVTGPNPATLIRYAWAGWRDRVQFTRLRTDEETLAMDVAPAR